MTTEYDGYTIVVTATRQADGLWAAKILIWPVTEITVALREHHEVEGYKNQKEAEEAGLQWGRKRINLYAQNKLR